MLKTIVVRANAADAPAYLRDHPELWFGNVLRRAGVPLFERSLSEGPHRGTLERESLPCGSVQFKWTDAPRREGAYGA